MHAACAVTAADALAAGLEGPAVGECLRRTRVAAIAKTGEGVERS